MILNNNNQNYVSKLCAISVFLFVSLIFSSYQISYLPSVLIVPLGFLAISTILWLYSKGTVSNLTSSVFALITPFVFSSMFLIPQYHLFGFDSYVSLQNTQKLAISSVSIFDIHYTPLSYSLPLVFSEISKITLLRSVKYMPAILLSLTGYLYYTFVRLRYPKEKALLASIMLTTVPWHLNFRSWAVKEQLGLPLLLAALIILIIYIQRVNIRKQIIPVVLVLVISLTISHHFSTAVFILSVLTLIGVYAVQTWMPTRLSKPIVGSNTPIISLNLIFIIMSLVLAYWAFQYTVPLVAGLSPIIDFGPNIGWEKKGEVVTKSYRSTLDWLRITWNTSEYQIGAIGMPIAISLAYRWMNDGEFTDWFELFCGLLSVAFVIGIYLSTSTDLPITFRRMLIWLWIPAIMMLVGIHHRVGLERMLYTVGILFVVLNVLSMPYHDLSAQTNPDWDAHEQSFGYQRSDFKTAQWIGEYGHDLVAYPSGYKGIFEISGAETVDRVNASVLFLDEDVSNILLHVTDGSRKFLRAGFHQPETNPPQYNNKTYLDLIYSSNNNTIYLNEAEPK